MDGPSDDDWPRHFPRSNGDIADLVRTRDWTRSPLGPPSRWSQSLRQTVEMMLGAHAQIVLFWGHDFVALYNDAYTPSIGDKHPRALGRPAVENWGELWDDLEPLLAGVRDTGETFSAKDRPFYIERHGYGETTYWDISYSAVLEDDGAVGGVLCIVTETTERVLATHALSESEARNRHLVEQTPDGIFVATSEGRYIDVNPAGCRMLGMSEHDVLASTFLDVLSPEEHHRIPAELARFDGGAIATSEWHFRRKDGSAFIGEIIGRRLPNGCLQGVVRDITERRHQEQRLRLLLDELNHRVKNTLATVQSMAAQSLRNATSLADARSSFEARLVALSKTHDVLTSTHWEGADLHLLMTRALSPYTDNSEIARFEIGGPTLYLRPKSALALSMGLHELATNAVKHGALSAPAGRVSVTWDLFPAAGPTHLRLEWREHRGPPVKPPQRRGFGSRLLERGLAQDIGGHVRLEFAPDGLVCTVEAPLRDMQGES